MDLPTILIISFGVSLDALAIAFSCGVTFRENRIKCALKMAFTFGVFQALMPVIGWFVGTRLMVFFEPFDHWIAFLILVTIGAKMIYEAIYSKADRCSILDINKTKVLLILALVTSIDALMVGVGFSVLNVKILVPVISMGIITFIVSFIGAFTGDKLGKTFGKKMEVIGGLVLIGIGLKIFWEHFGGK